MADDFFATLLPGDRIVVRYRLGNDAPTPGGPALTDALGEFAGLQEAAAEEGAASGTREATVAVRTRGGIVLIALSSVTHAKRVPPPPARRGPRRPDAG